MAPAVTIDNISDFDSPSETLKHAHLPRTLLLASPSIASQPETLARAVGSHDRNATDIQMLDRLSLGLVALPAATYERVILITDTDPSSGESARLLDRPVMERVVQSMKPGGRLQSQDDSFGSLPGSHQTEAILAGLVSDGINGMVKPAIPATQTVKLNFGKRRAPPAESSRGLSDTISGTTRRSDEVTTESTTADTYRAVPKGVGFVDMNDDFDGGLDDGSGYDEGADDDFPSNEELENAATIDPNSLLTEKDKERPIIIPDACKPNSKRRRACKDCTCGLAERLNAEDKAKRAQADTELAKLQVNDLNEVDFTVQGKVGSCGNCALGDAFRCDGCPYIGLPAFKPGEEVRLLNNDIQL